MGIAPVSNVSAEWYRMHAIDDGRENKTIKLHKKASLELKPIGYQKEGIPADAKYTSHWNHLKR